MRQTATWKQRRLRKQDCGADQINVVSIHKAKRNVMLVQGGDAEAGMAATAPPVGLVEGKSRAERPEDCTADCRGSDS